MIDHKIQRTHFRRIQPRAAVLLVLSHLAFGAASGCVSDTNQPVDDEIDPPENSSLSAPANFTAVAGNEKATLSWRAPSGVFTSYTVKAYTKADGVKITFTGSCSSVSATTTSCTVKSLTNGLAYYFKVAAKSALEGTGSFAQSNDVALGCGDGDREGDETCDDGNSDGDDGCSALCQVECGDGTLQTAETCDDGNTESEDGCSATCELECGNGTLEGTEACDDGNSVGDDGCSALCQVECGDGTLQSAETCDDGNTDSEDGCSATCELECGNGTLEGAETCDDGNTDAGDGCSASCELECGNGTLEGAEACDDGNNVAGDGCSATCEAECGNGDIDGDEACDDGNTASGDGCSSTCESECGNGTLEGAEACDDSNTDAGDGCSATCQVEVVSLCGDGMTGVAEQCDDGNTDSGDGCSASCETEGGYACTGEGCAACTAGSYASDGAGDCTLCPAGSYSGAGATACTSCESGTYAPDEGSSRCYEVGDTGPGGGTIFYIPATTFACGTDLTSTCGALEYAPADAGTGTWCDVDNCVATSKNVGTGAYNTANLVARSCGSTSAGVRSADYSTTVDGVVYDDWYLPSSKDFNQLCRYVSYLDSSSTDPCVGGDTLRSGFSFTRTYWTSSSYTCSVGTSRTFDAYGYQIVRNTRSQASAAAKGYTKYARPIRGF